MCRCGRLPAKLHGDRTQLIARFSGAWSVFNMSFSPQGGLPRFKHWSSKHLPEEIATGSRVAGPNHAEGG